MKRLLLVLGVFVLGAGSAFAAETEELIEPIGGFQTADAVVIGSAAQVVAMSVTCSSTACAAALYNGTGLGDAVNANGRHEQPAVANSGSYQTFDPPIRFTSGIVLDVDANVTNVVVYKRSAP